MSASGSNPSSPVNPAAGRHPGELRAGDQTAADRFDCWNVIGLEGDGTCGDLKRFVHCRNCPVYSGAGERLLGRSLPQGYRNAWADHFASSREPAVGGKISVVIFRVGLEWLALPTSVFQEILESRPVHSIPHRRGSGILGLVNVRGELLLCICVSRLLGFGGSTPVSRTGAGYRRLLVISDEGRRLVFPADDVHGVHRFKPEDFMPHQTMGAAAAVTLTRAVFRWGDRLVGLLEPGLLFSTLNRGLS